MMFVSLIPLYIYIYILCKSVDSILLDKLISPKYYFLVFEVSSVFLVDENQIEVIFDRKLIIDVVICGSQLKSPQEQPYWNYLPSCCAAIH